MNQYIDRNIRSFIKSMTIWIFSVRCPAASILRIAVKLFIDLSIGNPCCIIDAILEIYAKPVPTYF